MTECLQNHSYSWSIIQIFQIFSPAFIRILDLRLTAREKNYTLFNFLSFNFQSRGNRHRFNLILNIRITILPGL